MDAGAAMTLSADFEAREIQVGQTLRSADDVDALVERILTLRELIWPQDEVAQEPAPAPRAAKVEAPPPGGRPPRDASKGEDGLTDRQRRILELLREGLTPAQIAERLCITKPGVFTLRKRFLAEGLLK